MKASVIIPCHNEQKHIAECLNALRAQDEKCEVIVVDDASTDETAQIVKKFKNVQYFRQEKKGPAAARNLGARKAKGEILIFTDADCVPEKNFTREMLKPFAEKEIAGVQGAYRTRQKNWMARFSQLEIEERYEKMKKNPYIDFVSTYAAAYRKNDFAGQGGFDEKFPTASGEDTEFSYALSERGKKLAFAPNAIVFHSHPESLAQYLHVKFFRGFWRVRLYSKHRGKMLKDSYTTTALKAQIALATLLVLGILLSSFTQWIAAIALVLMIASAWPFLRFCAKKDKAVAGTVPTVVFLRSFAFLSGLAWGLAKGVNK
ncbi:MAG: glycosyltransferase [Candidatus Diapherotrites archaeon]